MQLYYARSGLHSQPEYSRTTARYCYEVLRTESSSVSTRPYWHQCATRNSIPRRRGWYYLRLPLGSRATSVASLHVDPFAMLSVRVHPLCCRPSDGISTLAHVTRIDAVALDPEVVAVLGDDMGGDEARGVRIQHVPVMASRTGPSHR